MSHQRQIIFIASPESLTSNAYICDVSMSLRRLGHDVEIWTIQRDNAEPSAEIYKGGVLIRRFRGQRDYLVPRVRPCAWVSEWVACATSHLATSPDVAAAATLVSFGWEAGVASRLLAQRFGMDMVHVPYLPALAEMEHAVSRDPISSENWWSSCRRENEDRETCRFAAAVVATTADQQHLLTGFARRVAYVPPGAEIGPRFVAELPPSRKDVRLSVPLASVGRDVREVAPMQFRRPWLIESDVAHCSPSASDGIF